MSALGYAIMVGVAVAVGLRITFRSGGFKKRASWPLTWRRAATADWPSLRSLGDDHNWARKTGTGFVAEHGDELLYLIDRDWFGWPDPPQWGLASFDQKSRKWRWWGDFKQLPTSWKVPEPLYA